MYLSMWLNKEKKEKERKRMKINVVEKRKQNFHYSQIM